MEKPGKRSSAYEIPYARVNLTAGEQRRALLWWQAGEHYRPLLCPVCGAVLAVVPDEPALSCPTLWCSYATREIPWGIYVAWRRFVDGKGEREG